MTIKDSKRNFEPNASKVTAYLFIFSILEGLQRISGLFYLETLQFLGLSRQYAAIPFTLSRAVANIIGPLFGQINRTQNSRSAIIWGTLLGSTGLSLCILATNLTRLIIFWGLIFGVGYAVISHHHPAVLGMSNNHEMMSACATSLGFVFILLALLLDALMSSYGIQGSYIIMAGIILNYFPLALATSYNIRISLPIMRWRVRKRNSKYSISERKMDDDSVSSTTYPRITNLSNESFVHSLEPDILRKLTVSDDSLVSKEGKASMVETSSKVSLDSNKELTEGTANNEIDFKQIISKNIIPNNRTLSEVILDVQEYEKSRNLFEESFSHQKDICEAAACDKRDSDARAFENSSPLDNKLSDSEQKDGITKTCIVDMAQEKEPGKHSSEETYINSAVVSITPTSENNNANPQMTSQSNLDIFSNTGVPLDIKVRVVECTFTSSSDYLNETKVQKPRRGYRRHSNSIPLGCYDNIDFTNKEFFQKCSNYSELNKLHLNLTPNIYSISEDVELSPGTGHCAHYNEEASKSTKLTDCALIAKSKEIFQNVSIVKAPVWFCVILIFIIYEFSLTSLILIFADFAKDVDSKALDFKWIFVAYGTGGIVGRLFFHKMEKRFFEKPYATDLILFMLNGLVTAGILWSPDLNWLAGFYCFLGALEVGTSENISRLVSDVADSDSQWALYSSCKIWSGAAVLTIPYAIGSSRDNYGDYELLLQGISCALVFCAIMCYFLPRITKPSKYQRRSEV